MASTSTATSHLGPYEWNRNRWLASPGYADVSTFTQERVTGETRVIEPPSAAHPANVDLWNRIVELETEIARQRAREQAIIDQYEYVFDDLSGQGDVGGTDGDLATNIPLFGRIRRLLVDR